MNFLGQDLNFWWVVAGATLIKVASSPYHSYVRALLTIFAAVFCAYVFTDPVLAWLTLDPATYKSPVAALVTLTGEGLMRMVLNTVNDPTAAIKLWKAWKEK
jgi:hypothetical protein